MKHVKWEECAFGHLADSHNVRPIRSPSDPITLGMCVGAHYQGLLVMLEITEDIFDGVYGARVMYFEPATEQGPSDLTENEDVWIDRKHICYSGILRPKDS